MNTIQHIRQSPLLKALIPIFIALSFLIVMLIFSPFREAFEMDFDEGVNLMKAMLLLEGYDLYSEIWSDQPPLFTFLLAGVFKISGLDVNAARVAVLVLSTLLLYGAARFIQLALGTWQAVVGVALIGLIPNYPSLSTATMVGLPAISLAVISLFCIASWHFQRKRSWLILAGFTLCLSVFTKAFTGFLVPIFLVGLLADSFLRSPAPRNWLKVVQPALIWGLSFLALALVMILLFVGVENAWQLVYPHVDASQTELYQQLSDQRDIHYYLAKSWPILILGLAGIAATILSRNWIFLYPSAWMLAGYVLLRQHAPVRYHHQLLITIPAAILGSIFISEAVRLAPQLWRKGRYYYPRLLVLALCIAGFGWVIITRVPEKIEAFRARIFYVAPSDDPWEEVRGLVEEMKSHKNSTTWVFTDRPMIAFRAGYPVIPELAVITEKRLISGDISDADILESVQEWQPEQVLIGRFDLPLVMDYLDEEYELISTSGGMRLYLAN